MKINCWWAIALVACLAFLAGCQKSGPSSAKSNLDRTRDAASGDQERFSGADSGSRVESETAPHRRAKSEYKELSRMAGTGGGGFGGGGGSGAEIGRGGGMAAHDDAWVVPQQNNDQYDTITENEFKNVLDDPQSTFSIDVDTASYSNVRRFLNEGRLPPAGAVRIEELVNYFEYYYPQPDGEHPFSVSIDAAACPWNEAHQLVRVGLAGKQIQGDRRPPCNLVFLLDVSGSMRSPDKLPLVKSAMQLLAGQLNGDDRVAMVVYAGASGLVLPSTSAAKRREILAAIERLDAGGSTNGGQGIEMAYQIAADNFIDNGINRVILCTDGDFNVGVTNQSQLISLIEDKAKTDVFLSVFGFGRGNLNDSMMEQLADNGNGVYGYVDNMLEAHRLMVDQIGATLITIAKDVKIQVDFNPAHVSAYRLIGYENRMLATEDFDDDTKDAGEIGAGHTVTALYEIVPSGIESPVVRTAKPSKFVSSVLKADADPETVLSVDLRYKLPDKDSSQKFTRNLVQSDVGDFEDTSEDLRFAAAVTAFGMKLRGSKLDAEIDWDWIVQTARENVGQDRNGFRNEFVTLAKKARLMSEPAVSVERK